MGSMLPYIAYMDPMGNWFFQYFPKIFLFTTDLKNPPVAHRGNPRNLGDGGEGRYGLVDKTHPSCVRPGLNTRVQH